jgi:hypothetical protein
VPGAEPGRERLAVLQKYKVMKVHSKRHR